MKIKELVATHLHTDGEVGVEIELEGRGIDKRTCVTWAVEHDASLKGEDTAEFVFRKPLKFNEVGKALTKLKKRLVDSTLIPSIRTGVHVHINVQDMELHDLAKFVTCYLVVEDLLLDVCGEGRQSNLFCLKGCEAEYMVGQATKFFREGEVEHVGTDAIRYSGINLAAIRKYGSVEFRSLRTPADLSDINQWVGCLKTIKDVSQEWATPADIISGYSGFDKADFLKKVLPTYAEQLMSTAGWEKKLQRGMRSAQDLAFSQTWVPEVVPEPLPQEEFDALPEKLQRLIRAMPHMDVHEVIAIYSKKFGE